MRKNMRVRIVKSLRFKLTLWYSILVLIFCSMFLFSMNLLISFYTENIRDNINQHIDLNSDIYTTDYIITFTDHLDPEEKELFLETRNEDLENIRNISYYALIPLTILSFISGYLISGQMLKPLKDLNDEIENLSTKNLGKQIEYEDTGDEITDLIKNFNIMSKRLGSSFELQREFVENASHELKTPLAVIQSNLDLALDDGEITKEELRDILEESDRSLKFMSKLTEDLLLLSILEGKIEKEDVDVVGILNNCIKNTKILIEENKFKVKIEGKKKFVMKGNEILLTRAFSNIVENSIKYSGGDEININIKKERGKWIVNFTDNGKGVPEKDLERMFERFYRIDKSRCRKTGGSGIGLSITKKIVENHQGNIYAENIDNGFRIVMEF